MSNIVKFHGAPCVITHSWECSACGAQESRNHGYFEDSEVVRPSLPVGWTGMLGFVCCPQHEIIVRIDGKEHKIA